MTESDIVAVTRQTSADRVTWTFH